MRHIDVEKLELPLGWAADAQKAAEDVKRFKDSSRSERNKEIDRHDNIWKSLKPRLKALSDNKCWFCESNETRSVTAVDHYRPKGAVKESSSHPGYWWLAFDPMNYRYCCQFCNELRTDRTTNITGGKSTHFPLLNPDNRVFGPGDLSPEYPELLDPTLESDILLISFDPDGTAQPRWTKDAHDAWYTRTETSILRYNLNHADLKERRQCLVCNKVVRLVKNGDWYFTKLVQDDAAARHAFNEVLRELRELMHRRSEYSAAAIATLKLYRDHPWVDAVVDTY